jgi:mannose-1-phosphate guanylyltransferase
MPSQNNNLYAVILAGGSGTRFWPLSRQSKPKQFLQMTGEGTLFQQTLARIKDTVPPRNTLIVANTNDLLEIKNQIVSFQIPSSNILLEPEGKNTAPAICWAAFRISLLHPDAVMAVLPSDHLVSHPKVFLKVFDKAVRLAREDYLVTLGIVPTRPETGYGYLETAKIATAKSAKKSKDRRKSLRSLRSFGAFSVARFIEKPGPVKAKRLFKSGRHLWNSGMFFWKVSTVLEEFRAHLPKVHDLFEKNHNTTSVSGIWPRMPNISIDYGILEKSKRVAAVAAHAIGWSDLGSWEALAEISKKDRNGNAFTGDVLSVDCRNSYVRGSGKLVAAIGLDNIVIVDTPDVFLVCRKDQSQRVREIVEKLKEHNRYEY